MGIRATLSKPIAAWIAQQQSKWYLQAGKYQEATLKRLINQGRKCQFGIDHNFAEINSHADFVKSVPIRDYEDLKPYVERVLQGEKSILWPGLPAYFAKTSGTTSGTKYIPITHDSLPNHINSARNALLNYVHVTGKSRFLDGKLIFLSGSPVLDMKAGIPTGRLSGIVNHHVPTYLRGNQLPSYATNCIEDWEQKVDTIVQETMHQPMSLISGIPPWVQMYFDRLTSIKNKPIKDIFPQFDLFVYGGVNFEPYKAKLFDTIGKPVDSIELYPASEGFIAYQDQPGNHGLLVLANSGIFFEFVPADRYFETNPPRLTIDQVELDKNYALIINSNAGLWGYSIGDTVKFISKDPYRLLVTGRIKHFISAFGEHVIGEEVEKAMKKALEFCPEVEIVEFTVAPNVTPAAGLPCHEWFIEFANEPNDTSKFIEVLDQNLRELNTYYDDLITGSILTRLKIKALRRDAFIGYMKSIGKLGGQNKVPRLSNDRKIAEALLNYCEREY